MQHWPEFVTATLNLRCGDVLVFSVWCVSKLVVRGTSCDCRTLPPCVPHLRGSLVQTVQFTHKSTLKVQLHLARSQWHPRNCKVSMHNCRLCVFIVWHGGEECLLDLPWWWWRLLPWDLWSPLKRFHLGLLCRSILKDILWLYRKFRPFLMSQRHRYIIQVVAQCFHVYIFNNCSLLFFFIVKTLHVAEFECFLYFAIWADSHPCVTAFSISEQRWWLDCSFSFRG